MQTKKCYVLDTNILMRNPEVLNGFADNEVVVPELVQRELNHLKTAPGQTGYEARQAANAIDAFYAMPEGDPIHGFPTAGGGIFRIENRMPNSKYFSILSLTETEVVDNKIVATAAMLIDLNGADKPTKLISGDKIMRQLARNQGVPAEGYKNDEVKNVNFHYNGWTELETDNMDMLNQIYQTNSFEIDPADSGFDDVLDENEYLAIKCGKSSVLARYKNGHLHRTRNFDKNGMRHVKPFNSRQAFQMDACLADPSDIPCVIVEGAAGTGKTYLAEACGLDGLHSGKYDRIIITRSMVNPDGEGELGILPGDTKEKMDPYLKPFYDNLEELLRCGERDEDPEQIRMQIDDYMAQGVIEIQPMSSIRGRTFVNSYIIIDEAQNTSAKQIETLITRLGDGSKLVILGDLNQIDTSKLSRYSNGLAVASERMRGSDLTAQITYLDSDVKRSPLAKDAVQRFHR